MPPKRDDPNDTQLYNSGQPPVGFRGRFNPTLSFDGVAIIIGVTTLCFWVGGLSERVKQQEDRTRDISFDIRALTDNQQQMSRNLAVLQQVLTDTTKH